MHACVCVCVCVHACVCVNCVIASGDVESTMPTKLLMETAAYIDTHSPELKEWFLNCKEEVLNLLADHDTTEMAPTITESSHE